MKDKMNQRQLDESMRRYAIIPMVLFLAVIVVSVTLIVLYYIFYRVGFLIALVASFILFTIIAVIFTYVAIKKANEIYYNEIYKTTFSNIKKLSEGNTDLGSYDHIEVKEINELNDLTHDLKTTLSKSILLNKEADYSSLPLEYVDEKRNIITFKSFKKNLRNIIYVSQSFRNVIIEVSYLLPNGALPTEEANRLFSLYINLFKDYKNALYMLGEEEKSLVIYLPVIDSFSRIKEQLTSVISDSSVVIRDVKGLENINARFALVCYPYSSEDYLLSDLRYAKRQDKTLNLFLPNRTQNNFDQSVLLSTSMNLNYMSKMLSKISILDFNSIDSNKNVEAIKSLFNDIANYLTIDDGGIIIYDNVETLKYKDFLSTDKATIFKNNKNIETSFISALEEAADDDNSYYFSTRNHANSSLGRQLDYYGINSGYYYLIKGEGKISAVIYFFNRHKDLTFDTYLRESLFIISLRIAHYFEKINIKEYLDLQNAQKEYILSLSDSLIYNITDELKLTYLSSDTKKLYPNAKIGEYCYKCLYGLDKQCHDCPLKTFRKKEVQIKSTKYVASLLLNERKQHNRAIFLEKIHNEEQQLGDLFNRDFLTYSYFSLYNVLKNEYFANGRGYVLLLCVDNYYSFISSQGNEGYGFALRSLIRRIKDKLKTNDVYIYNPTTIAVHFPYLGHADVINRCEEIYELSKVHAFDDNSDDQFKLTYLPISYPHGFARVDDYIKHMSDFYHSPKNERNLDFIYFSGNPISRSASKREFIISVIENEFSGQSTNSVNLQPIVNVKDSHIYGAEILLRINDVHRNVFFNAFDISRIAEQENKTHLITESLINFIGNLYSEHGKSTFKNNDFKRIAINIDQTYLRDLNLIKGVIRLCEANNLPNNFISFEVPEDIIPDNLDRIKKFATELSNYHIYFSVDRFTGEYIGSEKLKDLGFNEVKIARDLIFKIDKDPIQYKAVQDIVKNAHKVGISVAAVGVENEAQYKLLRELDPEMMVQGYYLYKPLSRSELINAIISYTK